MYVDFPHKELWGDIMASKMKELAQSIMEEPGCIWKIWTENEKEEMAGGVYLFDSRMNAEKYLTKHSERLSNWGYNDIRGRIFEINENLSLIGKAPVF